MKINCVHKMEMHKKTKYGLAASGNKYIYVSKLVIVGHQVCLNLVECSSYAKQNPGIFSYHSNGTDTYIQGPKKNLRYLKMLL